MIKRTQTVRVGCVGVVATGAVGHQLPVIGDFGFDRISFEDIFDIGLEMGLLKETLVVVVIVAADGGRSHSAAAAAVVRGG